MPYARGPRDETKQRLLDATLDFMRSQGISDLSMRHIADAIGTSHRLLIYHFGTKEGLLVEVVRSIELEQRRWFDSVMESGVSPRGQLRMMWERTCDPALDRHLRLFVEVYGHTVQGRAHTDALKDQLVGNLVEHLSGLFLKLGIHPKEASSHARLALATIRGLMLEMLITGDRESAGLAWKLFTSRYDGLGEAGAET